MFHPGDTVGPYTLLRTIGRGGYGEVWLAEKRTALLTTRIALKMPLVTENELEIVRQEAALWLQASGHPNIVPVLDADVYEGQVVIASEFIAGGTLHEWMKANGDRAPSLEDAVAFADGILAGLDYLHRVGLTHRDLKPENVLLQDGIPRLTDFGLARVLKTEAQTSAISGTPRYMAPETFSGSYSEASDLWAVGIMLQELLTGSHPFPNQDLMALMAAIQSQEPSPLPDNIPERLRNIVARLLTKSPADRYATASAVREALQNALQPTISAPAAETAAPAHPPHNLPRQLTSFIGREKEVAELKDLLAAARLLTLTGPGGCGKTRLSLKAAEEALVLYRDGVWLVELAPLTDASIVPQTIAGALGLKEEPGRTMGHALTEHLKSQHLLLVLDNCEHLLDATARLSDAILRECPHVRILATSREGLGIDGERTYRVPSLTLPDPKRDRTPESLSQYEAVRLFVERAQLNQPHFSITNGNASAVASVCHRLDGIPLALELAAARVRSLSVEEVNSRLDQRFRLLTGGSRTALPRQQTLRALIDWSYNLLNAQEKILLCRLSVFAGGWTLAAAEQVGAGESDGVESIEEWDVLDMLTSLVDKSLVLTQNQQENTRYGLLETVRQYARDRLAECSFGPVVRAQHGGFFLAMAEQIAPKLRGPEQAEWLRVLEEEHDNMRQALTFYAEDPENAEAGEKGLRLGAALQDFWWTRGYLSEGRQHLSTALAHPAGQEPGRARAEALHCAGMLAWMQGDYAEARSLFEDSLAIRRALGTGIGYSLSILGHIAEEQGSYAQARVFHEEALALARGFGNRWGVAMSLHNLGIVAKDESDYAQANVLLEESLVVLRELGDEWAIADALYYLGLVSYLQDNAARARSLHQESLMIRHKLGHRHGIAHGLEAFALLALKRAQKERCIRLWASAAALREALGSPLPPKHYEKQEREMAAVRNIVGGKAFDGIWAEGRDMNIEQAVQYALAESDATSP